MITIFDPRQLSHAPLRELHNGGWTDYNETPDRAAAILAAVGPAIPPRDHGMAPLAAVYDAAYLDFLRVAHRDWIAAGREGDAIAYTWPVVGRRNLDLPRIDARLGRYSYDAGTPIAADSWTSAYWSAQTALTALDVVAQDRQRAAFALCRPPGHHAGANYLGGYCFLNNAAVVAAEARRRRAGGGSGRSRSSMWIIITATARRTFSQPIRTCCSYRSTPIRRPIIRSIGGMPTNAGPARGSARR